MNLVAFAGWHDLDQPKGSVAACVCRAVCKAVLRSEVFDDPVERMRKIVEMFRKECISAGFSGELREIGVAGIGILQG